LDLLRRIERRLRLSGMTASRFGREAGNDRRFVQDLRAGREPRAHTAARVAAYLLREEGGSAA
jgi:hypothetical protein